MLYKVMVCACHHSQLTLAKAVNQKVTVKCHNCEKTFTAKPQWTTDDFNEAQAVIRKLRKKGRLR